MNNNPRGIFNMKLLRLHFIIYYIPETFFDFPQFSLSYHPESLIDILKEATMKKK